MDAQQGSNSSTSVAAIAATATDVSITESPPKYVPQFSAATEMILKRINSGVGSTNLSSLGITETPPGYEDMRRSVLMGMKTSMNMEIPSPPAGSGRRSVGRPSGSGRVTGHSTGAFRATGSPTARQNNGASATGKGRKRGSKAGQKRKRAKDDSDSSGSDSALMSGLGEDSDSDDMGSVTELPRITQSGRAVVKPAQFVPAVSDGSRKRGPTKRTQEHALCKKCGRGHSPAANMIVFCDGCNLGWHQMCHDPTVPDDIVKDEDAAWYCADCVLKRLKKGGGIDQTRGVSWQGRSAEDKRAYFSSLPHQHLVSLLMQACVLHPNLPIFPPAPTSNSISASVPRSRTSSSQPSPQADRRTNVHPQQPFPPPATAGLFSRTESNPNAPINFIRKITPGSQGTGKESPQLEPKPSSAPPSINVAEASAPDESRESTPASPPYPKPGSGLMAKLGPDDEDMEWLVDDGDFDSFSHAVYDGDGDGVNGDDAA